MTRVHISSRWSVDAQLSVHIDAGMAEVWAVMQRFSKLLAADPYHTRVTDEAGRLLDEIPPRGANLRIGHGIGLTVFERVGTMVYIKPGRGFAFTDLSKRGRNAGFPHVFKYMLRPIDDTSCELRVVVRGRWSARWIPRAIGRAWLWWVMFQAKIILKAHIDNELGRAGATRQQEPQCFSIRKGQTL